MIPLKVNEKLYWAINKVVMLAMNYIIVELDENSLEVVLLHMHKSKNNVYINPFTIAHLFLLHSKQRRRIWDTLLKWNVYLWQDKYRENKIIHNSFWDRKRHPYKYILNLKSKSQNWSFDINEMVPNDEEEEIKISKSNLSGLCRSSQTRNRVLSIPPITTQNESVKQDFIVNKEKLDKLSLEIHHNREYDHFDWKINRYFVKEKLQVYESYAFKFKAFEIYDFYEILIALCGFTQEEIFDFIYSDFWQQK